MLNTLLTLFFSLVMVGLLAVGLAYFWVWYYASPTSQDETHCIRTKDGWRLAVHRYRSESGSKGLPVILCHGLSANRYTFDLRGAPSLARYLRHLGWDVWVPELRGSGMSQRPGLFHSDVPYSWDFEDHLRQDLPAVMDFVLTRTGAPSLHWVGHSMGGMLVKAHIAANDNSPVASAVAVGSPAEFSNMKTKEVHALLQAKPLLRMIPLSPLGFLARLGIPFVHQFSFGFFHTPNVNPENCRKMTALAVEMLPSSKLWLNFARFVETASFSSEGGEPYLAGLSSSEVPVLLLGGAVDALAPPDSLVSSLEGQEGSENRKCLILGKASGCQEDYGHVDLMVGTRSESEVFPLILQWLTDHDPVLCKT